jgi:hypothetical protein
MTKIDPYKHKQRYENWRKEVDKSGIPNISKYNSDLTLRYLDDMECGYNVARLSAKGARSFIRLNTLRQKLVFFSKKFKQLYGIDKITEKEAKETGEKMEIVRHNNKTHFRVVSPRNPEMGLPAMDINY